MPFGPVGPERGRRCLGGGVAPPRDQMTREEEWVSRWVWGLSAPERGGGAWEEEWHRRVTR
jgi:hypothetical protein